MSRKLTVVAAMAILVASMGLKVAVAAHSDLTPVASVGSAPPPKEPWRVGSAPPPREPWRTASVPSSPWK
jgi:hypothetical protein